MIDVRRRFNTSERVAAFLIADGKCEDCGAELQPGWHGDHDTPYSLGGPTDAANIRALCPQCNLKKGKKRMAEKLKEWSGKKLRRWQERALDAYIAHEDENFLVVATPGAGKTTFALRVAHHLLRSGRVSRVVVVVPTSSLRIQWREAAKARGIQLHATFESSMGSEPADDYHGMVITYSAVAAQPDLHRRLAARGRTLVILDEVHHAGDTMSWGDAISHAFEPAEFRLAMSGTPFRGDNNSIPFVKYEQGRSRADFAYGYADSLRDGVCRTVFFPKYDGDISWLAGDEPVTRRFEDEASDEEVSQRLVAAVTDMAWMKGIIKEADEQLTMLRASAHPKAAGLVIAMHKNHARDIAQAIEEVTGQSAIVVHYDEPESAKMIEDFADNSARWIVAIKMVSEGVDIPRLRVCVYATNISTPLFFRQAVGRVVRVIEGIENTEAHFYMPDDRRLVKHALEIKHEVDHFLRETYEQVRKGPGGDDFDQRPRIRKPIISMNSAEAEPEGAVHDGVEYEQELIQRHAALAKSYGISPYQAASFLRELGMLVEEAANASREAEQQRPQISKDEQRKHLANHANTCARTIAGLLARKLGRSYQDCAKYVNGRCISSGFQTPGAAGVENLLKRIQFLERWEQELRDGTDRTDL